MMAAGELPSGLGLLPAVTWLWARPRLGDCRCSDCRISRQTARLSPLRISLGAGSGFGCDLGWQEALTASVYKGL